MPGCISAGWRMLSAFGGATGELVALLAKEGGGGAAGLGASVEFIGLGSCCFGLGYRGRSIEALPSPWIIPGTQPNNGRTPAPQYTVGTCVLAAVMGAYFKVRAAVGDGQPRAEVPGSLSGDVKPSVDAQTLKAIDEGPCGRS